MNKLKITSLLLAAVMTAVSMAGCASDGASDSSEAAKNSSKAETSSVSSDIADDSSEAPEEEIEENVTNTYESLGIDKDAHVKSVAEIMTSTKIPVISVSTAPGDKVVSREEYTPCVVDVFNTDDSHKITEASAGIKVRGNSSAFYGDVAQILTNQVPYRIKFDSKTNLLGLNSGAECKSWVLLKADWDLIRNDIAFRFGRAIMEGDDNFCSDSQLVHVYLNDEFKGVYLLCEQCQVNPNRVNISEPEKDYTGTDIGYYLEIDNYAWDEPDGHFFEVDYEGATVADIEGTERQFVPAEYSVKSDIYSDEQMEFIEKYTNNVFKIVYEACENGKYLTFDENFDLIDADFTSAEETVKAVMDIQSVVDLYILYEITHDYDCGEGSFFMCVDFSPESKVTKLKFTSPWDFNWAYNDAAKNKYWAAAFTAESFVNQYGDRSNPWFIVLYKQEWFQNAVKEKWTSLNEKAAIRQCFADEQNYLLEYPDDVIATDQWGIESSKTLFEWIYDRIDWLDEIWLPEGVESNRVELPFDK